MTTARLLQAIYWGAAVLLALPLVLIVLTSLSESGFVGFPLGRVGFTWYARALANPENLRAALLSAALAAGSAALAVAIATWIALAAALLPPLWRGLLLAGTLVPLVTPGIVHAIALRVAIGAIGLDPGPVAVLLGHTIHAIPLAVIMIAARLAGLPVALMEAATDLGAGPIAGFLAVQLPWLRPSLTAAALLAGLSSFDDFIRAFFLAGYTPTLPVLIFGRLHAGLTPEINALATLALIATLAAWAAGAWLVGLKDRGSPPILPLSIDRK